MKPVHGFPDALHAQYVIARSSGDTRTADEIRIWVVTANKALIWTTSRSYLRRLREAGVLYDLADIFQMGRECLLRAIDQHDPNRGSFSTRAIWVLRGEFQNFVERTIHDRDRKFNCGWVMDPQSASFDDPESELIKRQEGQLVLMWISKRPEIERVFLRSYLGVQANTRRAARVAKLSRPRATALLAELEAFVRSLRE